jgi:NTE family protein
LGISSLDPIRHGLQMLAGQHRFEDVLEFAGIPLAFVTSDVRTGERVVLKHGSLVEAALASSSILGVFDPITVDGHLLSDGSSVENLPVEAARALVTGRNGIVLAVDVSLTSEPIEDPRNALEAFARGAVISQEHLERASRKAADVVIVIGHEVPAHPFDFDRAEALFAAGLEAGRRVVPELRLALESAMTA